nr:TIGR02678 family protein [Actinospica robiniae]
MAPETDELRLRSLRHRLTRRLLDDPVVYYDELGEEERAYLVSQRIALSRRVGEFTGLVPELRAEGVAMVDPEDQLTDVRMPEQGTDGHITLLVATRLADAAARGERPPARLELIRHIRVQAAAHAAHWRKTALEPAALADLVDQALARLEALNLITRGAGADGEPAILARPAISRYALAEPTIRKAKTRA